MHKALNLGARVHLVEELQVFEPAQPVESLVLAGRKVSSATGRLECHRVTRLSPHPFSRPCRSCSSPALVSSWPSCPWPTVAATSRARTACWRGIRTAPGAATPASASASTASMGMGGSPGREGHPNVAQGPPFTSVTSSRRSHLVQDVLSSDTRACTLPQAAKQGETPPKTPRGTRGCM